MESITIQVYTSINQLPPSWNQVASSNAFLQTPYLKVLEQAPPTSMQCFYIGVFENNILIGVMLAQHLFNKKLESYGDRDKCIKNSIRNFIFKQFASQVLFIGNNLITGQNSYAFNKPIEIKTISSLLLESAYTIQRILKTKSIKLNMIIFKDFYQDTALGLKKESFNSFYEFKTQPNMIFELPNQWSNTNDYIAALAKKYRDQYKRTRKKSDGIVLKELSEEEIITHENRIYELYYYVATNAPFNTFFLSKNHFSIFKKYCRDQFKLFGYFLDNKLVGFHTLLLNGDVLETYFLGYDEQIQKSKMLYLNMLYNMTEYGIENQFKKIIFGRTALEIKSSIGAKPVVMSGFIMHTNKLININIDKFFVRLEPKIVWQERHPFKET